MGNIFQLIIDEASKHISETNHVPQFLYLGQEEWDSFISEAKNMGFLGDEPYIPGDLNPIFKDMRVFRVNVNNHLRCGI